MCIGPLSTLTVKRAWRRSQTSWRRLVWLSRFTQLSATGSSRFALAGEDDAMRREGAAEFLHREIAERFARAAGERMEQDKRLVVVEAHESDRRSAAGNAAAA